MDPLLSFFLGSAVTAVATWVAVLLSTRDIRRIRKDLSHIGSAMENAGLLRDEGMQIKLRRDDQGNLQGLGITVTPKPAVLKLSTFPPTVVVSQRPAGEDHCAVS